MQSPGSGRGFQQDPGPAPVPRSPFPVPRSLFPASRPPTTTYPELSRYLPPRPSSGGSKPANVRNQREPN